MGRQLRVVQSEEATERTHEVLVGPKVLVVVERSRDVLELLLIVADAREQDDGHDMVRLEPCPSSEQLGQETMLRESTETRKVSGDLI
jgi:hypothetical protein